MWSKKYDKCIVCGTIERKYFCKGMCRDCHRKEWRKKNPEYDRKWRKENPEKVKESEKRYKEKNVKKVKECTERYREENPEKIKKGNKKYYRKKFKKIKKGSKEYRKKNLERVKKWREENPEKFKRQRSNYWRKKSKNDIHFRLKNTVSSLIRRKLKFRFFSKKGKSTFTFLPYTVEELIIHLENLFTVGMTWDNYGYWHIDHKIADCHFNYKSVEDKEFQECWALENLQPLWALDNMKKGKKYIINTK